MKSVYCIIVTYNGMPWIRKCLESLLQSEYGLHIIVIDNASADQTPEYIQANFPTVECIISKHNLGFGQGNNLGLKIALNKGADYVFLLNQDAWVENKTIGDLVQAQMQNPEFGILSPLHLNGAGNNLEEHFYGYLVRSDIRALLWNRLIGDQTIERIVETPFVNAAAWLISSDCLIKTGGFDPIFFHYGEDNHYANRVSFKGFKSGILPTCRIFHDHELSNIKQTENLNKGINKEWILILNHACNINFPTYKLFMVKRGLRHSLQFILSIFSSDKYRRSYNYELARKIFSSFSKIKKSREICINGNTPYLKDL